MPIDAPEPEVKLKRAQMDKGLRIGSWGQLQGATRFCSSSPVSYVVGLERSRMESLPRLPTDVRQRLSCLVGLELPRLCC